jgi:hypothetical protein
MTMKTIRTPKTIVIAICLVLSTVAACIGGGAARSEEQQRNQNSQISAPRRTLRAFRSDQEITDFFREVVRERERSAARRRYVANNSQITTGTANSNMGGTANLPAPPPSPAGMLTPARVSADGTEGESVTNVQHAGVDEGGIVKLHGDYLVVLRRGRLFTVRIGDGDMRPVSMVDAFAPGINPRGAWYDEMLISGNTIAVIGYSYERGGTEIGLFQIDSDGGLRYRSTYHLRSNDYYSSRNYASRLIGNRLIFYTPSYLHLGTNVEQALQSFPALRRWHRGATSAGFRRIVSPERVYRAQQPASSFGYASAIHTVTVCNLADGEMQCEGTSVIGPAGRVFYVSPESVYVWTTDWSRAYEEGERARPRSMVYRMPLDGSAPSALGAAGSPVDQFSFLESGDHHLNVLVRSDAAGEGMWSSETTAGDVALMRVPLRSFSDGSENIPAENYRRLPRPEGYTFQNRFIGDYLLYGTGSGWDRPRTATEVTLYATRWAARDDEVSELPLVHGVDRIEAMGSDAVVVGTDGRNLHFTGVRLGRSPAVAHRYTREGASQGELRSHGFFYKPEDEDSGLLGLPIREAASPGYRHLFEESASILFLRNEALRLEELGELDSQPDRASNDNCRASCVDWYGNARPLFVRGRVFALLGYEMVEGRIADNRIREVRRVSFAPQRLSAMRR